MGKHKEKDRKSSKDKDKHSSKSKHKHSSSSKSKHGKSGRDKESSKHRSRRGSDSGSDYSSSSSDSDGGRGNRRGRGGGNAALTQLERDRAAVRAARALLAAHPGARSDLRQLLWAVDNGKAVGVGGLPDAALRTALEELLDLLGLKSAKGQHFLPSGAPPTLSVVGFVFDEPIQSAPAAPAPAPAAASAPAPAEQAAVPAGPAVGPSAAAAAAAAGGSDEDGRISDGSSSGGEEDKGPGAATGIGPAMPLAAAAAAAAAGDGGGTGSDGGGEDAPSAAAAEPAAAPAPESPPRRRVVGPAMPAPELLAAAATYAAEVEAGGGWDALDGGEEEDEEPLVGPPPPAFIEADAAAPADARSAEVVRVLRVLREAQRGVGPGAAAAPAAGEEAGAADPYQVLGVAHTAAAGEVRKAYWRLSLLVHPDKCPHAGAAEAFQAVSKAAATLQDAAQRKKVDDQREDARLRRAALDVAAEHERRRQWAALRGEKLPPELEAAAAAAAAAAAGPLSRETWMTELPPEMVKVVGPNADSGNRMFSRTGIKARGDTSMWTDTPEQAALRAAGKLPPPAGGAPLAIAGPSSRLSGAELSAPPGVTAAVKEYNEKHRQKSLLEQHMERQQAAGKKDKKEKKEKKEKKDKDKDKDKEKDGKGKKRGAEGPPEEDWVGKHPWRPFDRDKDLQISNAPKSGAAMLKDAAGLASRFSSGR